MAGHLLTTADGPLEDLWRADVGHSLTQGALWILGPKPTVRQGLELTVQHGAESTPPSCRAVIILLLLPAAGMPLRGRLRQHAQPLAPWEAVGHPRTVSSQVSGSLRQVAVSMSQRILCPSGAGQTGS